MIHLIRISIVGFIYFLIRPFIKNRKKFNLIFFTVWGIAISIEVVFTIYILNT